MPCPIFPTSPPREACFMSFGFRKGAVALLGVLCFSATAAARDLRVCADPNNLPFSNANGEGFENKIAQLLAKELGANLKYFWWSQRRGFIRNTLNAGECDLVTGSVLGMEMLRSTIPYYRSSYMFVTRRRGTPIKYLHHPGLRRGKSGHPHNRKYHPPPPIALPNPGL